MAGETIRFKMPVGDQTIDTNVSNIETPEQIAEKQRLVDESTKEVARLAAEKIAKEKEDADKLIAEKTKLDGVILPVIPTTLVEGQVIDLDGSELTINKEGNAIDNTGKVIKTSTELVDLLKTATTITDTNTTPDYIKEIQTKTNLLVTDEKGTPVTYENTVEGISKYTEDIYSTGKKTGAIEYEQTLLNEFPIIKDVINHLKLNGSLDGFTNKIDYSKIALDDKDDSQWLGIYIAAQTKRGIPEDESRATAKYFKEDGKLKEIAQKSLQFLTQTQQQESTETQNQILLQQQQEIAEDNRYWATVQNVILKDNKIKLGTEEYVIPKVMRITENGKIVTKSPTDFWNYVNVPLRYNIDGQVQEMTAHQFDIYNEQQKRTVNDDVFEALNRFLKNDKSQLIKAQLNTATAKQIIKLSSKTNTVGTGSHEGGDKKLILPVPSSKK